MEYLLIAAILYFILRTAGNLVGLIRGGEEGSMGRDDLGSSGSTASQWEGPSPRKHTGTARDEPTFWGRDVEDATWHDVENGSARQEARR